MTNNERIAVELFGYTPPPDEPDIHLCDKGAWYAYWNHSCWKKDGRCVESKMSNGIPTYDSDLNQCYLMEEKIKEKRLETNYFHKLLQLISGTNTDGSIPSSMDAFDWIHATAAQRTQACIQMLDELGGEQDGMRYSCND